MSILGYLHKVIASLLKNENQMLKQKGHDFKIQTEHLMLGYCKHMSMVDIEILPHQLKSSHFLVHFLLNQLEQHLLSHLKGSEQIEKQTAPHIE
jgi:hypothetical protein